MSNQTVRSITRITRCGCNLHHLVRRTFWHHSINRRKLHPHRLELRGALGSQRLTLHPQDIDTRQVVVETNVGPIPQNSQIFLVEKKKSWSSTTTVQAISAARPIRPNPMGIGIRGETVGRIPLTAKAALLVPSRPAALTSPTDRPTSAGDGGPTRCCHNVEIEGYGVGKERNRSVEISNPVNGPRNLPLGSQGSS